MTSPVLGQINKILPHSFVDGPGNRSVIFLQGCNFQCLYCHNPYTINFCNACGVCLPICPENALSLAKGKIHWQDDICVACDKCVDVCPNSSSPRIYYMSAVETWQKLKDYTPFISGVTVTGGEPTQQPAYLLELLKTVKHRSDLDTCIETNGKIPSDILNKLLPHLDFVMVDLKAFDPATHLELTGQENQQTLKTIKRLAEVGKLHMVRTTIVPGYTDTLENISSTASFLADIDPNIHLRLLRFRSHGTSGTASSWESPSEGTMDALVAAAQAGGLVNVDRSI